MNLGLPGNIIKVGSVREHGCRVEVRWNMESSGKDGMLELFRGMDKESRKFSSYMGDKDLFLVMKEMTIRSFEFGVGGLRVGESILKFSM